ncbi:hypothetical protein Hanom_Chr11g01055711 [Helianthus anomalus]
MTNGTSTDRTTSIQALILWEPLSLLFSMVFNPYKNNLFVTFDNFCIMNPS